MSLSTADLGVEKIVVESVIRPGSARRVDAQKYQTMRTVVLKVLSSNGPGLTVSELLKAVVKQLPQDIFPNGNTAGWWLKTVQLDLEANGIIKRTKSSPLRLHRA